MAGRWRTYLVPVLAAPLFLWGLGATVLWQDEAQTALLGRQVIRRGLPYAGEGPESASALAGRDVGYGGLLLHVPPLQAYVAATGMLLFGENSLGARALFAVAGLLCVAWLPWCMGVKPGSTEAVAAQVLLCTHVPFLLFSRQSRYPILAALLVTLTLGLLARIDWNNRSRPTLRAVSGLATCLTLLALTFDFAYLAAAGAVFIMGLYRTLRAGRHVRAQLRLLALSLVPSAVVYVLWLVVSRTAPSRQSGQGFNDAAPDFPVFFLGQAHAYVVPLWLVAALLFVVGGRWILSRLHRTPEKGHTGEADRFLVSALLFCCLHMVACTYTTHRFFRYLVPTIPPFIAVTVLLLFRATRTGGKRSRTSLAVAFALLALLVSGQWSARTVRGTAVLPWERYLEARTECRWSRRNGVHMVAFLRELAKPPRGPVACVVEYLEHHARPGQVVLAVYGEKPLKFHTTCLVFGGETGICPDRPADWIWPRHISARWWEIKAAAARIREELAAGGFTQVAFDGTLDSIWENRPDPEWHIFHDAQRRELFPNAPPVVLYRRTLPVAASPPVGSHVRFSESDTL